MNLLYQTEYTAITMLLLKQQLTQSTPGVVGTVTRKNNKAHLKGSVTSVAAWSKATYRQQQMGIEFTRF